jgi:murein DD-endopeptidase MepM/ murein hydrolase activator NlpD
MSAEFHPVMILPPDYLVYDLTKGPDPRRREGVWGIGRYNEKRPNAYNTPLFAGVRNNHVGIDFSGPVGTALHAFSDGEIFLTAYNAADGDYGYTIISKHAVQGRDLFALSGHLSKESCEGKRAGQRIRRGEVIAWIGAQHENGNWPNPHLHFQISFDAPEKCDMPGVVADEDLDWALRKYPDPRLVVGPVY